MNGKKPNTLTPEIRILLDKLNIASQVYKKASSRIHNQLVKEQLGFLAERKVMFLESIVNEMKIEVNSDDLKMTDQVSLELDKALIELNHIILNRNEREVLSFCIKREDELVKIYKRLIYSRSFYPFIEAMIVSQLDESIALLNELKEIKDAFAIQPRDF
jgi:hypothetical protein